MLIALCTGYIQAGCMPDNLSITVGHDTDREQYTCSDRRIVWLPCAQVLQLPAHRLAAIQPAISTHRAHNSILMPMANTTSGSLFHHATAVLFACAMHAAAVLPVWVAHCHCIQLNEVLAWCWLTDHDGDWGDVNVSKVLEEVGSQAQVAFVGQPDGRTIPQQVLAEDVDSLQAGGVQHIWRVPQVQGDSWESVWQIPGQLSL